MCGPGLIVDRTENRHTPKWISIVDEYTRECLALVAARSLRAEDIIDILAELLRGVPRRLRSDNGPELIASALRAWLERTGAKTAYIASGAPWENGYAESFHARLRDELLNVEVFGNLAEAKQMSERWQLDYNHRRPHSALGYQTPAEFASASDSVLPQSELDDVPVWVSITCTEVPYVRRQANTAPFHASGKGRHR